MESDALRPSVTGARAPRARTGAATYIYAFFSARARGASRIIARAPAPPALALAPSRTAWHAAGWQRVLGTQVVALR
eukprot:COSAG02_NODE_66_length_42609_cov_95.996848_10_plen_77_part_00